MTTTTDLLRHELKRLQAVLCAPEGRACILGSPDDLREVDEALASLLALADEMERAEPVAWAGLTADGKIAYVETGQPPVPPFGVESRKPVVPLYTHSAPDAQRDADIWSMAHRLALDLECLLLATDNPAATKYWAESLATLDAWRAMQEPKP